MTAIRVLGEVSVALGMRLWRVEFSEIAVTPSDRDDPEIPRLVMAVGRNSGDLGRQGKRLFQDDTGLSVCPIRSALSQVSVLTLGFSIT